MSNDSIERSPEQGANIIRHLVKTLPDTAGVYRMLDAQGNVLYVGKARSLKKRVTSYTQPERQSVRIQRMIAATADMAFVGTQTEAEALLLEADLIKTLKPRYNILLRDDKSYPYILVTDDHDFPMVVKHRGARKRKGDYFGPFASGSAVNETLALLQKIFKLRNCSNSIFAARTRPCLQYHIKRCTAPCVGLVSKENYAKQVNEAQDFLTGKSQTLQERYAQAMQTASDAMDFEAAAQYRDKIRALTTVQSKQGIIPHGIGDADLIAVHQDGGKACVQIFFFRGGQNFGNRSFFPRHDAEDTEADILAAFLAQFYRDKNIPPLLLVSTLPAELELLEEAFSLRADRRIKIESPSRGERRKMLDFAATNAHDALRRQVEAQMSEAKLLEHVAQIFGMSAPPKRIEVYDNSHISGSHMTGAMIVAGADGLQKNAYRKFNIKTAKASDDFGMMREVMSRRFANVTPDSDGFPDLLLIDGGMGQLNAVRGVLEELGLFDRLTVVGIAKGVDRNAGREEFFMTGRDPFRLPPDEPVLHYLQRLRDESHRFVIGSHRTRRVKAIESSPLDSIAGIGAKRKKALLHHFGSAHAVMNASIADLMKVEGISRAMAEKICETEK